MNLNLISRRSLQNDKRFSEIEVVRICEKLNLERDSFLFSIADLKFLYQLISNKNYQKWNHGGDFLKDKNWWKYDNVKTEAMNYLGIQNFVFRMT